MEERRSEIRMLCADMVEAHWKDKAGRTRKATALLEDISRYGACLQFERAISIDAPIELVCAGETFHGYVRYCVFREIGYFVGIQFDPASPWTRRHFKPQHLLDLGNLIRNSGEPGS